MGNPTNKPAITWLITGVINADSESLFNDMKMVKRYIAGKTLKKVNLPSTHIRPRL